jgi:hypothetical protein
VVVAHLLSQDLFSQAIYFLTLITQLRLVLVVLVVPVGLQIEV